MIDLLANEEEQAIADNIADVLSTEAPVARLRHDGTGEAALRTKLATLGWIGMGLAERDGGVGYGATEELLLFRSAGRHLIGPGFLAATLAAHLAARAGDAAIAADLISGAKSVTLLSAVGEHVAGPRLSGQFHRLDGQGCDYGLVVGPAGAALVPNDAVTEVAVQGIDDAVTLDRVTLSDRPALLWLPRDADRLDLRADLLIAAMLAGLAEGVRDLAVDYAKVREQFGQPIGAFQATKHRCADMTVRCEAAWSLVTFATLAVSNAREDAEFQTIAARLLADDAALRNAAAAIQVHGGIGFTAECDAHLFLKRARLWTGLGTGRSTRLRSLLRQPEPVRAVRRTVEP